VAVKEGNEKDVRNDHDCDCVYLQACVQLMCAYLTRGESLKIHPTIEAVQAASDFFVKKINSFKNK